MIILISSEEMSRYITFLIPNDVKPCEWQILYPVEEEQKHLLFLYARSSWDVSHHYLKKRSLHKCRSSYLESTRKGSRAEGQARLHNRLTWSYPMPMIVPGWSGWLEKAVWLRPPLRNLMDQGKCCGPLVIPLDWWPRGISQRKRDAFLTYNALISITCNWIHRLPFKSIIMNSQSK